MGSQIPAGQSKWTKAFQTRQFDTQVHATSLTPWLADTDQWIGTGRPGSIGSLGDVSREDSFTGPTAGEGSLFSSLANPPAGGVTASHSPSNVFAQNTDPTPGTMGYIYSSNIDSYIEGDLGYDNPPES